MREQQVQEVMKVLTLEVMRVVLEVMKVQVVMKVLEVMKVMKEKEVMKAKEVMKEVNIWKNYQMIGLMKEEMKIIIILMEEIMELDKMVGTLNMMII